jgi:hypothetical protein
MEAHMTQFYFRHGSALSEKDNARVVVGAQGVSGSMSRMENCDRCGGQGGSEAWKWTGYTCYKCNGNRLMPANYRVYTAEKLAKLVEAAEKKAAKKEAKRIAALEIERAAFTQWAEQNADTVAAIRSQASQNDFMASLAVQLRDHRILTDRQLEAAAKSIVQAAERKAEGAASQWVGEVKERFEFEAEVMGVFGTEGFYGHTDIVKFKDADGNHFTWFASDYTNLDRGDRIAIKGTVKKHDEYKGVKQTVLTRCKYTKFEIVDPDDAAEVDAETLTGDPLLGAPTEALSANLNEVEVTLAAPEKRTVQASQVFVWHVDAVTNGELEEHADLSHEGLAQAIADLESLGHITVEKVA